MELIIQKIKKIAKVNSGGFTIRLSDLQEVKFGWAVGMKETQNSFGDQGLKKVYDVAINSTGVIGGWEHEGFFFWDSVLIIQDEEEATRIGRENGQRAIHCLHTGKIKRL